MRNTGNRGIEAIHGTFRGGTSSLPITSPNLYFQQFLARMNKAIQIHTAEHNLKQIKGNTVVASRKKRATNAVKSSDPENSSQYTKPDSLSKFLCARQLLCVTRG